MARRATRRKRPPSTVLIPILVVVGLAAVVLAGLAVLPAQTWFSQRRNTAEAESELVRLEAETAQLEQELRLLGTDAEIERRARQDFDMVFPGEESYRIQQP